MADDDVPRPEADVPAPGPGPAPAAGTDPGPFYGPRPGRRRRWLWLAIAVAVVVVAVVVTLAVQRSGPVAAPLAASTAPEPAPSPSSAASRLPGQPGFTLPGSGGAVVYLQTSSTLQRAELGNGTTTVTATPQQSGPSNLLAGPGWVVSKAASGPNGFLLRDGGPAQLLPVALQQAGRVFPARDGNVWAVPQQPGRDARTALLLDAQGNRVGTSTLRVPNDLGMPIGHVGGDLLASTSQGSYIVGTDRPRHLSKGVLLGVGTDAVLTWDCNTKARCDARTNRLDKPPRYVPAVRTSIKGLYGGTVAAAPGTTGALSPDVRWVALDLPHPTRSGATLVLVDLRSGHRVEIPGALAATGDQAAWTPNGRYLLAVTDGRLRVFDSTSETVRTMTDAPADLVHLTIPGTAAM